MQQHVRRRVYIKLKLECTRNRSRDAGKARDVWLCVYCRGSFPSKLRLTDHRIAGCACGPVDSNGSKWELPVYPNLKTAKQGKDVKETLERGDGELWDNLHDDAVWLELNLELRDVIFPPPRARVHERHFMEDTLESLKASLPPAAESRPHPKPKASIHRRPNITVPAPVAFVDLHDDDDVEEEHDAAPCQTNQRSYAEMEEEHRVFVRNHKKRHPQHRRESVGGDRPRPNLARGMHTPSVDCEGPPSRPIRVIPIASRSPSPDADVFWRARSPAANVSPEAP